MTELTEEEIEECKNLMNWIIDRKKAEKIDSVLEWMEDSCYLNAKGSFFIRNFWNYVHHNGKHSKNYDYEDTHKS